MIRRFFKIESFRTFLVSVLVFVLPATGCKRESPQIAESGEEARIADLAEVASPLDTGVSSNSKQRFINLIRYRLNLMLDKKAGSSEWDLWAEGSTNYPLLEGREAFMVSLRRINENGKNMGLLLIGRMEGDMASVLGQWEINASIDDIHVVDLGLPSGLLIHTVSMSGGTDFNSLYQHLLRFDGRRLIETWSVRGGYDKADSSSYRPPIIRFSDTDKNGMKEVLVTISGTKPPGRKRSRWAQFAWNDYGKKFIPKKNLVWSGVAHQKPMWAAFGFMEALSAKDEENAREFVHGERDGCIHPDDLVHAFNPDTWHLSGPLRQLTEPFDKNSVSDAGRAVISMPLRKQNDAGRYEAQVELIKTIDRIPHWSICRVRFLKW